MERMAAAFELPIDAALGALRVEILSGREVLIENHHGLLEFEEDLVCINSSGHIVKINGNKLRIVAMNASQLRISGKVISVELC